MLEIPEDRCERHRLFQAIDSSFKAGDFDRLAQALGGSPRWFDEPMPFELGLGHPLEYAIYWSPLAFIERLIEAGSNANYDDDAGFPSLIAALSTTRTDRLDLVRLLVRRGADLNQRGINDWTPLHYAASTRDFPAIRLLLESGADPTVRTRIDNLAMPQDEAEAIGFTEGAEILHSAHRKSGHGA
jgi:hypothetical protein